MDEDESSEGDSQRIAMFQKQAKRRVLNKHRAQQESVASLPGYTSQAEASHVPPPKYPSRADKSLTAEEADEERDEVGDVVRRVRLRRKRSGSDSYLDSLLARSVHALELSNALLQSSMTTQSSLSALLSREDQLESHAQFLANQIHTSDSRIAWVDDMSRQLDPGLSQSLPDAAGGFLAGGLQQGDRPRSPPPRCMTVYADHTQDPDSILIPSTNGLRSAARIHDLVEDPVHLPRKRSGLYGIATASSPQLSTPVRRSARRSSSNLHLPPEPSSGYTSSVQSPSVQSPNIQTTHSPQTATASSQYLSSPVRPILSSIPAEPSTPAYNLLSAIATRTPGTTDSESEGRRVPESRNRLAPRLAAAASTTRLATSESRTGPARQDSGRLAQDTSRVQDPSRLTVDPHVPRLESQISPGLDKRPRHLSETDMGTVRGKGSAGWVAPMLLAGQKRGDSKDDEGPGPSLKPGGESPVLQRSHSARVRGDVTPRSGTSSRSNSKPPTPSRTSTNSSVPHRAGSTSSSNQGLVPSPNRPVRHPFLAGPGPGSRRRSVSNEDERNLQRYRSADALRKILDDAAAKRKQEEEERARLAAEAEAEQEERGRKPLVRPTWSVIPRRGTTVAVETVAPVGTVSIEGITGTGGGGITSTSGGSGGGKKGTRGRTVDPLVLPGEFWVGPVTAEPSGLVKTPSSGVSPRQDRRDTVRQDTIIGARQDTLVPAKQDTLTPRKQDTLTPTSAPDSPTRQRSQSMGPVTRLSSLLPKISVFGKATGVGEPPPVVDKGKGKAVEEEAVAEDIPRPRAEPRMDDLSKTPVAGPSFNPASLSLRLNGTALDPDVDTEGTTSESETESQPSQASLPLPPRLFLDSTESISNRRPSSLRISPRPSSLKQPGSGASTPRSVTFSPLPPKHIASFGRPLSEANTRRKQKQKDKEKEKPGWFASWFGPMPSSSSGGKYGVSSRRGWDSPRSMDDWQM